MQFLSICRSGRPRKEMRTSAGKSGRLAVPNPRRSIIWMAVRAFAEIGFSILAHWGGKHIVGRRLRIPHDPAA